MTPEEKQEAQEHEAYLLGCCVGVEEVAGRLRVRSGDYFVQGRDTEAQLLRSLAKDVDARAVELRKKHSDYRRECGLDKKAKK